VGPKHSGKTSAGAALAELLGVPFCDLDAFVERLTGKSPRALYREGEAVFRAAEAGALCSALAGQAGPVVAAGGGIIDNAPAIQTLRSAEVLIVYLETDEETAWRRVSASALPPFLDTGKDSSRELHRRLYLRRAPAYRELARGKGFVVRTEGKTPLMIAQEIAAFIRAG
jgi:shikimate kinase